MTDTALRHADLKRMLHERRRDMQDEVQSRLRNGRAGRSLDVQDEVDHSDAHIQSDIELALTQMKAETLSRVDEALVRLDKGDYGRCAVCDAEIPERRLRALPFAVRCQECEQRREDRFARQSARGRGGLSIFSQPIGP